MADYTPNPNTRAQLLAQAPKNIGEFFSDTVLETAKTEDVFGQWEGAAGKSASIVQVKTDLSKGKGQTVNFPVVGKARGPGVRGDGTLEGNEDFLPESSFNVQLDEVVNGLSDTQLSNFVRTWGGSRSSVLGRSMAEWLGFKRQADGLMTLRARASVRNTLRPSGKAQAALLSVDTMSTDLIDRAAARASTIGVRPTVTPIADSGSKIEGFMIYGADDVLHSLNADGDYRQAAFYAQDRGANNTFFRGGYRPWRSNTVYHHYLRDEDSYGPQGSPFLPKVLLGASGSDTTVTLSGDNPITLYGSGVPQNTLAGLGSRQSYWLPYVYMLGYDYKFLSYQDATSDSTQYYAWLYDELDKGVALIRYQGSSNTGLRIIANRWTANGADAAAGAVSYRYVGGLNGYGGSTGLDSNASTYNWKTVFNVGSTWVIPCTKWGVPLGWSAVLGQGSLLRAYGDTPMRRITNMRDYGRTEGEGILSRYGQNVPVDALGRKNGHLLLELAVDHPGFDLPVITSAENPEG